MSNILKFNNMPEFLAQFACYMIYDSYYGLIVGRDYRDLRYFFDFYTLLLARCKTPDLDVPSMLKKGCERIEAKLANEEISEEKAKYQEIQKQINSLPSIDFSYKNLKSDIQNCSSISLLPRKSKSDLEAIEKKSAKKMGDYLDLLYAASSYAIVAMQNFFGTIKDAKVAPDGCYLVMSLNEFFHAISHLVPRKGMDEEQQKISIQHTINHFNKMSRICYTYLLRFSLTGRFPDDRRNRMNEYVECRKNEYFSETCECDSLEVVDKYYQVFDKLKASQTDTKEFVEKMTTEYNKLFKQGTARKAASDKSSTQTGDSPVPTQQEILAYFRTGYRTSALDTLKRVTNHDPHFAEKLHSDFMSYGSLLGKDELWKNVSGKDREDIKFIRASGLRLLHYRYSRLVMETGCPPVNMTMYEYNKAMAHISIGLKEENRENQALREKHKRYAKSHVRRAIKDCYKLLMRVYFSYFINKGEKLPRDVLKKYQEARVNEVKNFNTPDKHKICKWLSDVVEIMYQDKQLSQELFAHMRDHVLCNKPDKYGGEPSRHD